MKKEAGQLEEERLKEYLASKIPAWKHIVSECEKTCRKTVKSNDFFLRYDMWKEYTGRLGEAENFLSGQGKAYISKWHELNDSWHDVSNAFLHRMFEAAQAKAKTEKGKSAAILRAYDSLYLYYETLDDENLDYVFDVKKEAGL